jgi:23S rRNA maturation mini-RNase III
MTSEKNTGSNLLSALLHTAVKACGASDKQADALSALSALVTDTEEEEKEEKEEKKPRRKRGAYNRSTYKKGGK